MRVSYSFGRDDFSYSHSKQESSFLLPFDDSWLSCKRKRERISRLLPSYAYFVNSNKPCDQKSPNWKERQSRFCKKNFFFSRVSYFAHQSVQGKLFMVHDALEKMSPILKMNGNLAALWFSDFLALHVSLFTCNYVKIAARVIILCLWLWK